MPNGNKDIDELRSSVFRYNLKFYYISAKDIDDVRSSVAYSGRLRLTCSALTRQVYVNGILLPIDNSLQEVQHSKEFNWGYAGSGPAQLAFAVLQMLYGNGYARQHYHTFKHTVIALIGGGFADVLINIRKWREALSGENPIHAYHLMKVNMAYRSYYEAPFWVSKFLDFGNMGNKSGLITKGTVEYEELTAMGAEDYSTYAQLLNSGYNKGINEYDVNITKDSECFLIRGQDGTDAIIGTKFN